MTARTAAAETVSNADADRGSPLPGPEVLYDSPASAPQLENANGWEAEPLMVSGADAYIDGEFLYQDFVYDDYGANTTALPLPPTPEPNGEIQSELLPTALNEPIPELTPIEAHVGTTACKNLHCATHSTSISKQCGPSRSGSKKHNYPPRCRSK